MSINSKNIVTSKNFIYLEKLCLTIARKESPVDTGNMRDNAIYVRATSNGFQIVWDNQFAYYLPIVDKGLDVYAYSDILPRHSSNGKNKGTRIENIGFVDRTINKLNEVCQQYINSPKDIYKEYANRKIVLGQKSLQQIKNVTEKSQKLISSGEMTKAKRVLKRLYNDPIYRRFLTSQIIYDKVKFLEGEE